MPGFKTHYLYGRKALEYVPSENKRNIELYPNTYNLGIQGGDVFFYHLLNWTSYERNISSVIHSSRVMDFFSTMVEYRDRLVNENETAVADAYICGFMGHYTLDCLCHPYVFYRTNHMKHLDEKIYDFGHHLWLETDMDNEVYKKFTGNKPSQIMMGDTIRLSEFEKGVVASLLYESISTVYPEHGETYKDIMSSINAMRIEANLMNDPSGFKKKAVRAIEQLAVKHSYISSIIPSDQVRQFTDPCNERGKKWCNPWKPYEISDESIYDLMEKGYEILAKRIGIYCSGNRLALLEELGDLSYDSGLPL